jgi:hypothetical protein
MSRVSSRMFDVKAPKKNVVERRALINQPHTQIDGSSLCLEFDVQHGWHPTRRKDCLEDVSHSIHFPRRYPTYPLDTSSLFLPYIIVDHCAMAFLAQCDLASPSPSMISIKEWIVRFKELLPMADIINPLLICTLLICLCL